MSNYFSSNRRFQLWEYRVGHGSLLIRSPKSPESPDGLGIQTNVDIIFGAVEYLATPRHFDGIQFDEPTREEMQQLEIKLGKPLVIKSIHILVSSGQRFPVVSTFFSVEENEKDIFESPFNFN